MEILRYVASVAVLLALSSTTLQAAEEEKSSPVPFRIETRGGGTTVKVKSESGTILDIHCRGGIGRATVSRTSPSWPMSIRVRLHVKGLESFRVSAGKVGVGLFVPSGGAMTPHVHAFPNGREGAKLAKGDPLWVKVRVVAAQRKIPLVDGYFEMALPSALFHGNPESITIQWVDFFRG